ncbi:MAG: MaoC family dehydratase N-terminal domain-containing protein [Deltaproteobacteria bacterium]|nr:MaoC family dehydratase N-terminal domain-containing protein [Deltaproteobacteria bacterium]
MGLNREYIGKEFPPVVFEVTEQAIHKYAWAIGARNLTYFNYNGALNPDAPRGMAPPSFSVVYELPMLEEIWTDEGLHGGKEQAARNVLMLVHGEQEMHFYKPIRPGNKITARAKVKTIEDKGSGELIIFNVTSTDQSGEKVVESDWGIFVRGIGSGQKPKNDVKKEHVQLGGESPLAFRKIIRVDKDITYRYAEASNDRNPIHIDENVAKAAGLKGIIVHGLCTMSMSMRTVIICYLDSDPSKLKSLGCRFTSPVYPGDTLVADGWEIGEKDGKTVLGFEVTRRDDDVKVIKGGIAVVDI